MRPGLMSERLIDAGEALIRAKKSSRGEEASRATLSGNGYRHEVALPPGRGPRPRLRAMEAPRRASNRLRARRPRPPRTTGAAASRRLFGNRLWLTLGTSIDHRMTRNCPIMYGAPRRSTNLAGGPRLCPSRGLNLTIAAVSSAASRRPTRRRGRGAARGAQPKSTRSAPRSATRVARLRDPPGRRMGFQALHRAEETAQLRGLSGQERSRLARGRRRAVPHRGVASPRPHTYFAPKAFASAERVADLHPRRSRPGWRRATAPRRPPPHGQADAQWRRARLVRPFSAASNSMFALSQIDYRAQRRNHQQNLHTVAL